MFDAGQGAGVINQVRLEDIAGRRPSDEVLAGGKRETAPDLTADIGTMFRESHVKLALLVVMDRDDIVGAADRLMAQARPVKAVG